MFVVAYPRETQEMVLDAHNKAFAFYGGVPLQMIYDNLKTVVDTVFVGKERKFNRRFMALANHYLFEPVACTPAARMGKRAGGKSGRQCQRMAVHPASPV
jgi:transposase